MKFLLLLFIALSTLSFSQTTVQKEKQVNPLALYTYPEFFGGKEVLDTYIQQNLKINRKDKKLNTSGEIVVKFFIGIDGSISNTAIINNGLSKQLNKEALRVISEMPNWIPGTQNGIVIETMYAYTIQI